MAAGSAIKDERVDAEKAPRKNETYSKEKTKMQHTPFQEAPLKTAQKIAERNK